MSTSIAYNQAAHIVIDIETLGTCDDAAILELGFAIVVPDETSELHHVKIESIGDIVFDLQQQIDEFNRKIQADTLLWWLKQGAKLQMMYTSKDPVSFSEGYLQLAQIVQQLRQKYPAVYFWSRGSDFDFRILKSLLDHVNIPCFWKFWEVRDIRTVSNPLLLTDDQLTTNTHYASDDAYNEASELVHAINRLVNYQSIITG